VSYRLKIIRSLQFKAI